jgi:hypothetical protein
MQKGMLHPMLAAALMFGNLAAWAGRDNTRSADKSPSNVA